MPLSDHEQRMLDQIESALYAEDPKFASSVRGGTLRAPSARRRLQGAALFVIGLAMLVSGVAFQATRIGGFPILSVVGFIVMFGGVVFAITGPRVAGGRDRSGHRARSGAAAEAGQGLRRFVHQSHGGPVPPPFRRVGHRTESRGSPHRGCPFFVRGATRSAPHRCPTSPHLPRRTAHLAAVLLDRAADRGRRGHRKRQLISGSMVGTCAQLLLANGAKWGIVG